ncbi:MAG: fructosamine kinase family protein [Chloroherpetonaceae bacterium]|nr:fructosamine kinase family protein [Chthonomonadaceae bacterium]MDW8209231.1 fructosamine kinase family protein [Chloroherpetonaceae bacterium]
MNALPEPLHRAITNMLGAPVTGATRLSGGMINHATRVDTTRGPVFVKWQQDAPPRFFESEATGLRLLRRFCPLRVPEVLGSGSCPVGKKGTGRIAFLVLEYLEPCHPSEPVRFARQFGEGLATLHRETYPEFTGGFGLPESGYIGVLPQINEPLPSWPEFYRERRLRVQIELARQRGLLSSEREFLLMRLLECVEDLLADLPSRPVLIHGDLWSGNYLAVGNEPVLIDPAVHYAEREVEIAYMELFGGFPHGVLEAYQAHYPLEPGYRHRRPLHQLYPLLVHLNLFGETYGPSVEAICRHYLQQERSGGAARW